jgi:enoyl-[acyl-carrier-protein] reductase (NADH)
VADDQGFGWAIAKALAAAGAEILVGTWVPVSSSLPPHQIPFSIKYNVVISLEVLFGLTHLFTNAGAQHLREQSEEGQIR